MTQPYKFIVTLELAPGTRERTLTRAPEMLSATRAESGCLSLNCLTCTDDPDRLVFIESWRDEQAYTERLLKDYTQRFLELYEPFHRSFSFETVTAGS